MAIYHTIFILEIRLLFLCVLEVIFEEEIAVFLFYVEVVSVVDSEVNVFNDPDVAWGPL